MNKQVEQIRAEIERKLKNITPQTHTGVYNTCIGLLSFIDSLPEGPLSDDMEGEIESFWNTHDGSVAKIEYQRIIDCAHHFADWQKQQMIKSAKLSGWVARDEDGSLHIFEVEPRRSSDNHRWWDRDYYSTGLDKSDFPDLKWEDEPVYVKLPIIVEE
jgi:hypothetical protein